MLTADEIEGAQQVAFRQQIEDAEESVLARLAEDDAALRTHLPPAMTLAEGRAVVRQVIDQRRLSSAPAFRPPTSPAPSGDGVLRRLGKLLASVLGRRGES